MKDEFIEAREDLENSIIDYYCVDDKSYFDDDVKVKCFKCKKLCFARPYYPRNKKIICLNCLGKLNQEKEK